MARLVGVDLPRDKRLEIALTYIYGIGRTRASEALAATGVDGSQRVRDMSEADVIALRDYIDANFKVEGDLRREVAADIRRKGGDRLLPGAAPPARAASAGSADPHQRPHPQGPAQDRGRQEEGRQVGRWFHPGSPPSIRRSISEDFGVLTQLCPKSTGARKVRRKEKKNVAHGHAHIKSTFNNMIVSITDPAGAVIAWSLLRPGRLQGLAQVDPVRRPAGRRIRRAPRDGARHAQGRRLRQGPGSGRETAIRSLQAAGLEVGAITDVTPVPFNGCRPPKRRRV